MIYITGDTHGDWVSRLDVRNFPEQKEMTKDDYVIICGDFGLWDGSRREACNLDWLEEKSFTTLFVSGNHENYDILDELPVEEWHGGKVNFIRPSVIHLKRGQVFNIDGKKFFTFGGASSHDIQDGILDPNDPDFWDKRMELDMCFGMYRINHISWWERELPSAEEMAEGVTNLADVGNNVDYIITHCSCNSTMKLMPYSSEYKTDILTNYLQKVRDSVEYKHWYFGHMHQEYHIAEDKATCTYRKITRIE